MKIGINSHHLHITVLRLEVQGQPILPILYGQASSLLPVNNEMQDRVRLPSSAAKYLYNLEKRLNIVHEIVVKYYRKTRLL